MTRQHSFSVKRFLRLIKNDLFMNRYLFFITTVAAMGLMILFLIFDAKDNFFLWSYRRICLFGLYIGGFLISMTIFSNIYDEKKGHVWHTLPASLLEKLSSRLVLATLVFTCGWYLLFFVVMIISEGLFKMLSWQNHEIFNPVNPLGLISTLRFWIFQSLFVFGAIYFRKHAPAKTVLALVGYGIFLVLIGMFAQDILFGKYISEVDFTVQSTGMYTIGGKISEEMATYFRSDGARQILSTANHLMDIFFWYILMPVCWVMTYIRFREMEI